MVTATGSHTTMGELSLLLAKSDADSKLTTLHLEVNHFVRIGTPPHMRKPPTVASLTCLSPIARAIRRHTLTLTLRFLVFSF